MIRSMTGFGRCESATEEYRISVEMKAVNHRYLDLGIKMPKKFNLFEASIRNLLKEYIQRGKIDVYITYEDYTEEKLCLKYNSTLASEYMDYFQKMQERFGIENDVRVSVLARMPEVLTMTQAPEDEEHMWKQLSLVVEEAARNFVEARNLEGEKLKADLLGKLDYMESLVDFIEERSPEVLKEYRSRLENKVSELLDEETVRLRSHINGTRKELEQGGSVGRKLDFIAQEMNREANTILSKSTSLEISGHAIALKTEIEKVREQIQNIE